MVRQKSAPVEKGSNQCAINMHPHKSSRLLKNLILQVQVKSRVICLWSRQVALQAHSHTAICQSGCTSHSQWICIASCRKVDFHEIFMFTCVGNKSFLTSPQIKLQVTKIPTRIQVSWLESLTVPFINQFPFFYQIVIIKNLTNMLDNKHAKYVEGMHFLCVLVFASMFPCFYI